MRTSALLYLICVAYLLNGLAGCTHQDQERFQFLNSDGIYLYEKGDFVRAKESFELALQHRPGDPGLLYNLAKCQEQLGKTKEAEESFRLCLEKDPNHVQTRLALAQLLLVHSRRSEADEIIEGWLAAEPKLAGAYVADGWRLQQDGDLQKAQARLQQALDLDPHNVHALTQLGILYEVMQRPERALVLYQRALDKAPDRTDLAKRINYLKSSGIKQPLPDG